MHTIFASEAPYRQEMLAEFAIRILPLEDRKIALEKFPLRLMQVVALVGLLTPEVAQSSTSEARDERVKAFDLFGEMYGLSAANLYEILFEPSPDRNLLLWLEAIAFNPKACRRLVCPQPN